MTSSTFNINNNDLAELINAAREVGANSLQEAAVTDDVDLFPEKTLGKISTSNLLTAGVSSEFGGKNLGLIPGTNLALLTILKIIGSGNLVMGRVLEGHLNAQILIHQFGTAAQQAVFAADAFAGKLFGVWNTQAADGTSLFPEGTDAYLLSGSKIFATGTGYVSRPIVTASLPDGSWQMCVVPMDELWPASDAGWWHPMGMRSSRSYKVTFDHSLIPAINSLGKPGDYYQQPGFSGGSVRFAAVQLGAAEMLFDQTRNYLCSLNRTEDPYQKMRLGKMAILVESGNQWLKNTAFQMDHYMINSTEENSINFLAYANMMRTAIEQICVEIMEICQKCVGARGLNKPHHFERIIRDLSTYLRQPAPDAALADVGKYVLQSNLAAYKLWDNNFTKRKI